MSIRIQIVKKDTEKPSIRERVHTNVQHRKLKKKLLDAHLDTLIEAYTATTPEQ